jgi:small subunit ribosomal protein S2
MSVISMKALLETGVHFGHRTRKWNPEMKPYIFTERNGIHIIDLQQTLQAIEHTYAVVRQVVSDGGTLLFVGTKRQAQETIEVEATRGNMPYVNSRWLGGTLTNWRTIRSRIDELERLERRRDSGELDLLTKKEALMEGRKIERLEERLGGIRNMRRLPALVYVVDVRRETTAIHEANLLEIPVIALVDTNCDPRGVDYVIPSNDDAIRAIKLITAKIADAALEGWALRKEEVAEAEEGVGRELVPQLDLEDEDLLGAATLAKLKSGAYGEDEKAEDKPELVQADEPQAVQADEPQAVQTDEPQAVQVDEPQAVESDEPEAVQVDEPQAVQSDEPQAAAGEAALEAEPAETGQGDVEDHGDDDE